MYNSFFNMLLKRKEVYLNQLKKAELIKINILTKQMGKLDREVENQNELLKKAKRSKEREAVDENISALKSAISKVKRQVSRSDGKIKLLDDNKPLIELYYNLKLHPDIEWITIDENSLVIKVVTKKIIARKTNIGRYVITMDFEDDGVLIRRFDNMRIRHKGREYYHPFITGSGEICFGDASREIKNAIHQGGFYSITLICIELLKYTQSANPYVPWHRFRKWIIRIVTPK